MDIMLIGMLLGGFVLLVVGAEVLVRGAATVAAIFGISPLVIGLTVVAFGTSAPELAVSIQAGLAGSPDIAMANVVGSNIFNILFTLGLSWHWPVACYGSSGARKAWPSMSITPSSGSRWACLLAQG